MAEVQRFLAAAAPSPYGPIWAVVLATGMRRGEVLGLRWQDVDFERRVLHVRQSVAPVGGAARIGATKNSRSRTIQGVPPYVLADGSRGRLNLAGRRDLSVWAFERAGHDRKRAAELLGVHPNTIDNHRRVAAR